MQHSLTVNMFCISGDLQTVYLKVIIILKLCIDTESRQKFDNGKSIFPEINLVTMGALKDKREIEVSFIVENCSASGDPSDNRNIIPGDKSCICFSVGNLMLPYNH